MEVIRTVDFQTITKLNKSVHDLHVRLYPERFKEYDEKMIGSFFKQVMNNNKYLFLLIKEKDENIGYAWIEFVNYPETPFTVSYETVYVHQINILASHQGSGYGAALMREIVKIGRNNNMKRIDLDYWIGNEEARNFYAQQGFKKYREYVYREI